MKKCDPTVTKKKNNILYAKGGRNKLFPIRFPRNSQLKSL